MMASPLATETILSAWEAGYGLGIVAKGLVLLGLAAPHEPASRLLRWSVGKRDAALLLLRARLFGQVLKSLTSCPQCGQTVEIEFRVDDICSPMPDDEQQAVVALAERDLPLRKVTSEDLLAVQALPTRAAQRCELLRRCLQCDPARTDVDGLTDADLERVSQRLAECDPQADVHLALACAACDHEWSTRFDIVAFLWKELDAWAQRLLGEVHALAFAYGWSEREIVAMTPWRRQIYLEMLRR